MEDLIQQLRKYKGYSRQILCNSDDVELDMSNNIPWLFFNNETILEYTSVYQIQQYRGTNTLFLAQSGDACLLAIFQKDRTTLVVNDLGNLKKSDDVLINGNLEDVIHNVNLLDLDD